LLFDSAAVISGLFILMVAQQQLLFIAGEMLWPKVPSKQSSNGTAAGLREILNELAF
jgi:hypothetical protein